MAANPERGAASKPCGNQALPAQKNSADPCAKGGQNAAELRTTPATVR